MTKIPNQLKKREFRFIKVFSPDANVDYAGKRPVEKNWQKGNNYKWDSRELQEHLEKGGNYGVLCGKGNLIAIDADEEIIEMVTEEKLPDTFAVKSGGGGTHYYYKCKRLENPIRLTEEEAGDLGDIQTHGKFVVGPGSTHPTGNKYKVKYDREIKEISTSEIREAFNKYIKKDIIKVPDQKKNKYTNDNLDLNITDVVDTSELEEKGGELRGPHPLHGSKTGRNFSVNPEKNTWYCFRHGVGSGPIFWLALKYGILDYDEVGKGNLTSENFVKTLKKAIEDGYLDESVLQQKRTSISMKINDDITIRATKKKKSDDIYIYLEFLVDGKVKLTYESKGIPFDNTWHRNKIFNNMGMVEIADPGDKGDFIKTMSQMGAKWRKMNLSIEKDEDEEKVTEETPEREITKEEREKAEHILKEKHPLTFITKTIDRRHKGDMALSAISYLSAISCATGEKNLHLWAVGQSGKGKSHLLKTTALALPNYMHEIFTSLSSKALFYYIDKHGENSLDKMWLVFDEVEASKDAIPILRSLTSQTKITPRHMTVDMDLPDKLVDLEIKGSQTIAFTSVTPLEDDQLRNRFILGNPNESTEQDEAVFEYQDKKFRLNQESEDLDSDFYVSRAITAKIIEDTEGLKVVVPYKPKWGYKQDRRLYPLFLTMLKLATKIFYKQRKQIDDYLIATRDDFEIAKVLWNCIAEYTKKKISEKSSKMYERIPTGRENKKERVEIAKELDWTTREARYHSNELLEADMISKDKNESRRVVLWRSSNRPRSDAIKVGWSKISKNDILESIKQGTNHRRKLEQHIRGEIDSTLSPSSQKQPKFTRVVTRETESGEKEKPEAKTASRPSASDKKSKLTIEGKESSGQGGVHKGVSLPDSERNLQGGVNGARENIYNYVLQQGQEGVAQFQIVEEMRDRGFEDSEILDVFNDMIDGGTISEHPKHDRMYYVPR